MQLKYSYTYICVALAALNFSCRGGESENPPVHLIHNMDTQEKGRPYRKDTSGIFANGRMMQAPIEGTVAIGQLNDDDVLEEGVENPTTPTTKYPTSLTVDDAFRARGANRFAIYCSPCHGMQGDGKGPLAMPALDGSQRLMVPPPSFHDARLKGMAVGKIYSAIKNGVNAGNMPSYAAQIPVRDRWAIVSYVRRMQMTKDPSMPEFGGAAIVVANASKSSVEHGKQLYEAKGCNACHSLDGSKLVGPSFKGVYGKSESTSAGNVTVDDAYIKESILQPTAKVVTGFPPAMPPQILSDIEIGSVTLFIKSLK